MAFDLGQPVPLSFTVTDNTGAPAAGTVTLTITQPDGTAVAGTVANPATGSYSAVFIATQFGRHMVRWLSTGANDGSATDEFNVSPPGPPLILSLAEVKAQLRMNDSTKDAQLRTYVAAVTAMIEDQIGPVVQRPVLGEYVDLANNGRFYNELNTVGVRAFVLRQRPVISFDAINSAVAGSGILFAASDFTVEAATGIVRRLDNGTVYGPLLVDYTVGMAYVPAEVELAAMITIQHLWETQRGTSGPPGLGGNDTSMPAGYSFAMPNRAQALLKPHLSVPAVG